MRAKRPTDAKLIAGPYRPPRCRLGDLLYCDRSGEVVVSGFTDRLRWPYTLRYGQVSPILCGDLVRAVRIESAKAVAYWWGVSRQLVFRWRRSLDVPRITPGTRRLRRMQTFSDIERRRSSRRRKSADSRAKSSRVAYARWHRDGRFGRYRRWSRREIRLLGTDTDAGLAQRIGRTVVAVTQKRRELRLRLPARLHADRQ